MILDDILYVGWDWIGLKDMITVWICIYQRDWIKFDQISYNKIRKYETGSDWRHWMR